MTVKEKVGKITTVNVIWPGDKSIYNVTHTKAGWLIEKLIRGGQVYLLNEDGLDCSCIARSKRKDLVACRHQYIWALAQYSVHLLRLSKGVKRQLPDMVPRI